MEASEGRFFFEAYGVAVDVEVRPGPAAPAREVAEIESEVAAMLPPGATVRPESRPAASAFRISGDDTSGWLVQRDGLEPDRLGDRADALHVLDGAIRSAIAEQAPGLVFVHAGVVSVDGRAIVLPGRSMVGKTTLVVALVEAGAAYLSDEYAVFGPDGEVGAYPRRLSIRGERRREVPVADLGGTTATGPMPVAMVASLAHRPGALWRPEHGDAASCALALIDNAIAARTRSEEVLRTASTVARSARFVTGERGEADDAAAALLALVRG